MKQLHEVNICLESSGCPQTFVVKSGKNVHPRTKKVQILLRVTTPKAIRHPNSLLCGQISFAFWVRELGAFKNWSCPKSLLQCVKAVLEHLHRITGRIFYYTPSLRTYSSTGLLKRNRSPSVLPKSHFYPRMQVELARVSTPQGPTLNQKK